MVRVGCSRRTFNFAVQAAPTASSDRVCSKQPKACMSAEYESRPLSMKKARVCTKRKVCSDVQFLKGKGGPTKDDICADHLKCKGIGTEYEVTKPTATSDRACKAVTKCKDKAEKEKTKPTKTTDRVRFL